MIEISGPFVSPDATPVTVETLAELKALTTRPPLAINECRATPGDEGGGPWTFITGDQSANITLDPLSNIWAAPDISPGVPGTGALGAWKRQYEPGYHYAVWGGVNAASADNAAALNAALAAFPNKQGILLLPAGTLDVASQIDMPSGAFGTTGILMSGTGKNSTVLRAVAGSWGSGDAVVHRGISSGTTFGGGLTLLTVDANKEADYAVYFEGGKSTIMSNMIAKNAIVTEGLFGHATLSRFYETNFVGSSFFTDASAFTDPADRSDYNLRLLTLATDNQIIDVIAYNAKNANIKIEGGGNIALGIHTFGFPGTMRADYGVHTEGLTRIAESYIDDGYNVAGIFIDGTAVEVGCNVYSWLGGSATGAAIKIATSLSQITILPGTVYGTLPGDLITYDGTQPTNSSIYWKTFQGDGLRSFFGPTQTLAGLGNARVQIAGVDFGGSSLAQGRWSADVSGPQKTFYKSRGATIGASGIVASQDQLGILDWSGDDGANARVAARILARVGTTPGASDMPGTLEVYTTPDGSLTPTLRLTFDYRGNVIVGSAALATDATSGFLYIPGGAGPPTGTPTAFTGRAPLYVDTTNNKLHFYSTGAWRDAGP